MKKFISLLFVITLLSSCGKYDHLKPVVIDKAYTIEVYDAFVERGILIINNKFTIVSWVELLDVDYNLSEECLDKARAYRKYDRDKVFITDIVTPFEILKKENSEVLQVVKCGDTLNFKLEMPWYHLP